MQKRLLIITCVGAVLVSLSYLAMMSTGGRNNRDASDSSGLIKQDEPEANRVISAPLSDTLSTPISVVLQEEESTSDQEPMIKVAAETEISLHPNLVKNGYSDFEAGSIRMSGEWALVTLRSYPLEVERDAHAVVADIYGALAEKTGENEWVVYLETEEVYIAKIKETPDSFLSGEEKDGALSTAAVNLK